MTQIYGQHDRRDERIHAYQRWLNCEQVVAHGQPTIPPPHRVNVHETIQIIRQSLQQMEHVTIDVQGDDESISLIQAQLNPDELQRVQFSSRTTAITQGG